MEEISYCPKCGAYIPGGADKCLACGFTNKSLTVEPDLYVYADGKLTDIIWRERKVYIDLERLYRPFLATLSGKEGRAQIIRQERSVLYDNYGRTRDGRSINEMHDHVTLTLEWIEL